MTELIDPGIPVDAHLYKAQLFIHMLCTKIVEIRIQPDLIISIFTKETVHQQTQTDFSETAVLGIWLADLDAYLTGFFIPTPIIHLSDRHPIVKNHQVSACLIPVQSQKAENLILRCAKAPRKSGMCHDASVIPPRSQLPRIFRSGVADCNGTVGSEQ